LLLLVIESIMITTLVNEISRRGLVILALSCFPMACKVSGKTEPQFIGERLLGISFVAANEQVTEEDIRPITSLGATWVSLMPYGFVRESENIVLFNTPSHWWGESDIGLIETIELARYADLKIMIKPQVWFRHGEYTGAYMPPDSARMVFEQSFEDFVLHYADLAEKVNADLYCIGTEWHKFIDTNPEFWHQLIVKVKQRYKGQLTYAANWDEYKTVPFWSQLDFIGVNAYFPLSDKNYPTKEDLHKGWQPWVRELGSLGTRTSMPILFTEFGYRSTVKNASKPWESYTKPEVSMANQRVAYQVIFDEFRDEPWFAGGFVWKWFHNHEQHGGEENIGFTPQNKPVEAVIKAHYQQAE